MLYISSVVMSVDSGGVHVYCILLMCMMCLSYSDHIRHMCGLGVGGVFRTRLFVDCVCFAWS